MEIVVQGNDCHTASFEFQLPLQEVLVQFSFPLVQYEINPSSS
jgi:hypothetical protein